MNEDLLKWAGGGIVGLVVGASVALGVVAPAEQPAESPPVVESRCPAGWLYQPQERVNDVLVQHRCANPDSPYIVFLAPNSDVCQYGRNTQDSDLAKTVECANIPGWSR